MHMQDVVQRLTSFADEALNLHNDMGSASNSSWLDLKLQAEAVQLRTRDREAEQTRVSCASLAEQQRGPSMFQPVARKAASTPKAALKHSYNCSSESLVCCLPGVESETPVCFPTSYELSRRVKNVVVKPRQHLSLAATASPESTVGDLSTMRVMRTARKEAKNMSKATLPTLPSPTSSLVSSSTCGGERTATAVENHIALDVRGVLHCARRQLKRFPRFDFGRFGAAWMDRAASHTFLLVAMGAERTVKGRIIDDWSQRARC